MCISYFYSFLNTIELVIYNTGMWVKKISEMYIRFCEKGGRMATQYEGSLSFEYNSILMQMKEWAFLKLHVN